MEVPPPYDAHPPNHSVDDARKDLKRAAGTSIAQQQQTAVRANSSHKLSLCTWLCKVAMNDEAGIHLSKKGPTTVEFFRACADALQVKRGGAKQIVVSAISAALTEESAPIMYNELRSLAPVAIVIDHDMHNDIAAYRRLAPSGFQFKPKAKETTKELSVQVLLTQSARNPNKVIGRYVLLHAGSGDSMIAQKTATSNPNKRKPKTRSAEVPRLRPRKDSQKDLLQPVVTGEGTIGQAFASVELGVAAATGHSSMESAASQEAQLTWPECHQKLMELMDLAGCYTEEEICALLKVDCSFDIELLLTKTGHNIRIPTADPKAEEFIFWKAACRVFSEGNVSKQPSRTPLQTAKAIIAKSEARKSPCVIGLSTGGPADDCMTLSVRTLGPVDRNLDGQLKNLCDDLEKTLKVSTVSLKHSIIDPWVRMDEQGSDRMEEDAAEHHDAGAGPGGVTTDVPPWTDGKAYGKRERTATPIMAYSGTRITTADRKQLSLTIACDANNTSWDRVLLLTSRHGFCKTVDGKRSWAQDGSLVRVGTESNTRFVGQFRDGLVGRGDLDFAVLLHARLLDRASPLVIDLLAPDLNPPFHSMWCCDRQERAALHKKFSVTGHLSVTKTGGETGTTSGQIDYRLSERSDEFNSSYPLRYWHVKDGGKFGDCGDSGAPVYCNARGDADSEGGWLLGIVTGYDEKNNSALVLDIDHIFKELRNLETT